MKIEDPIDEDDELIDELFFGSESEFKKYLDILIEANDEEAFVVISVKDADDFFNIKFYDGKTIEIDYPLVTKRQKSKEQELLEIIDKYNLTHEIKDSQKKGKKFIDIYVDINQNDVSSIVKILFNELFLTNSDTEFCFDFDDTVEMK